MIGNLILICGCVTRDPACGHVMQMFKAGATYPPEAEPLVLPGEGAVPGPTVRVLRCKMWTGHQQRNHEATKPTATRHGPRVMLTPQADGTYAGHCPRCGEGYTSTLVGDGLGVTKWERDAAALKEAMAAATADARLSAGDPSPIVAAQVLG